MNIKQFVLLMFLAILFGGLTRVAIARELEVHSPTTRITISDGEDIEIESPPEYSIFLPQNWLDIFTRYRFFGVRQPQLRVVPQTALCNAGSISSQTLQTTRSSSGGSYSHSSVTTTSCQ